MNRRRKAFTLVELLVVIGIIAVLVAILLPALNKARQGANTVVCAGNMRQIGLAMFNYAAENNGTLPWGLWWFRSGSALPAYKHPADYTGNFYIGWDALLSKYLGQPLTQAEQLAGVYKGHAGPLTNVLRCPADGVETNAAGTFRRSYVMVGGQHPMPIPTLTSYGCNETDGVGWSQDYTQIAVYTANGLDGTLPPYCTKLARIRGGSAAGLLCEQVNAGVQVNGSNPTCAFPNKQVTFGGVVQGSAAVHGGLNFKTIVATPYYFARFNYLFCDGHVDFLFGSETVGSGTLATPKGLWTTINGD